MADEELQEYKLKELKETQDQHDARLKVLETNKIEMKMEFQNLKQSQIEQKALILELDRSSREKNDRLFDKMFTSQDKILNKVLETKSNEVTGKIEITKGKIAFYGSVIAAIVTVATLAIEKIWG